MENLNESDAPISTNPVIPSPTVDKVDRVIVSPTVLSAFSQNQNQATYTPPEDTPGNYHVFRDGFWFVTNENPNEPDPELPPTLPFKSADGNPFVPDPETPTPIDAILPWKSIDGNPIDTSPELPLTPTVTTGPINNPIITTPQTVASTNPVTPTPVDTGDDRFNHLLNLFDSFSNRNIPAASSGATQSSPIVIPASGSDSGGTNYTGLLLIIAVIGLAITVLIYRKKIVSEIKGIV